MSDWSDGWMNVWMDGRMKEWTDGWKDVREAKASAERSNADDLK